MYIKFVLITFWYSTSKLNLQSITDKTSCLLPLVVTYNKLFSFYFFCAVGFCEIFETNLSWFYVPYTIYIFQIIYCSLTIVARFSSKKISCSNHYRSQNKKVFFVLKFACVCARARVLCWKTSVTRVLCDMKNNKTKQTANEVLLSSITNCFVNIQWK